MTARLLSPDRLAEIRGNYAPGNISNAVFVRELLNHIEALDEARRGRARDRIPRIGTAIGQADNARTLASTPAERALAAAVKSLALIVEKLAEGETP